MPFITAQTLIPPRCCWRSGSRIVSKKRLTWKAYHIVWFQHILSNRLCYNHTTWTGLSVIAIAGCGVFQACPLGMDRLLKTRGLLRYLVPRSYTKSFVFLFISTYTYVIEWASLIPCLICCYNLGDYSSRAPTKSKFKEVGQGQTLNNGTKTALAFSRATTWRNKTSGIAQSCLSSIIRKQFYRH